MLKTENAVSFNQGIDLWMESVEQLVDGVHRGLTIQAFDLIVTNTAQWSGNMAASWTISVGSPNAVVETPFKDLDAPVSKDSPSGSSYLAGSAPAITYAKAQARADGALSLIRLGVTAYISTGVPYAVAVDEDIHPVTLKAFLRPGNPALAMVARVEEFFSRMGELSEIEARRLAARSL
jgi:hypothetical protein